jgi:membrane protein DedA with SNARE-associated domain
MVQTLSDLSYGLIALGAMLEGEITLALGALAAQRGFLDLSSVIAAAFAGALAGDQVTFLAMRWSGERLLRRFPRLAAGTERVRGALARRAVPAVFLARFLWGMRMPAYGVLANSGVRYTVFAAVNIVACLTWATAVGLAAFAFTHSITAVIARLDAIHTAGLEIASLLAGTALVAFALRWLFGRLRAAS